MSRYIDAEKLLLHFKLMATDEWNESASPSSWSQAFREVYDDIGEFPTADVEEVVRCAECKFFNREDATTNGMCRCDVNKLWQPIFYRPYRRFRDFCSYGEKMDGGTK